MLKFFKRRRPQHRAEQSVSLPDVLVARYHRIAPAHFANLPAIVQVDLRESFYQGQRL